MELSLTLLSALCWTLVYIEIIRLGIAQRACGMPFFALAFNIAWEALYGYLSLRESRVSAQGWVNVTWFCFDVALVVLYVLHGKATFSRYADVRYFWPWSTVVFGLAAVVQYVFLLEFGQHSASAYTAFLQNLVMSILFVVQYAERPDRPAQSMTIAIAKCIGTLAPTILYGAIEPNRWVLVIGLSCFVFDALYILLLSGVLKPKPIT